MKKTKLIIGIVVAILIVTSIFVFVQKKPENKQSEQLTNTALVQNIQEKIQSIDFEKNYDIKVLNNEKFVDHMTDGGGQLTGYFKDGKLVKVVERLGLSYGVITYEYYFSNEELLLVKEREEYFPDTENAGTLDYTKLELAFRGEYYFNGGKLIASHIEGQKRFADGFSKDESKFIKMSQENIEILRTQE